MFAEEDKEGGEGQAKGRGRRKEGGRKEGGRGANAYGNVVQDGGKGCAQQRGARRRKKCTLQHSARQAGTQEQEEEVECTAARKTLSCAEREK